MAKIDVFQFRSSAKLLAAVLAEKRRLNPKFSLRAWATHLKIASPGHLSRILNGKRPLSIKKAQFVAERIGLDEKETAYFVLLVKAENASIKAASEKQQRDLLLLQSMRARQSVTPEEWSVLLSWHRIAILELVGTREFRNDPEWISRRLGGKISPGEAESAMNALLRGGYIFLNDRNRYERTRSEVLSIDPGLPQKAIRDYHRQMIHLALDSIESQPIEHRQILSSTLTISKSHLEPIRQMLYEVHQKVLQLAEQSDGDEVVQISSQVFLLTQPEDSAK